MTDIFDAGSLKAQDPIYLGEDRYEKPKELHKTLANLIGGAGHVSGTRVMDVGCATGEFLHYLRERFPDCAAFDGVDVSPAMIAQAKERVPGARFDVVDLSTPNVFADRREYDVVFCSGVLSVFDDVSVPVANLLQLARSGGSVIIATMINQHPIDVVMRYRRTESDEGTWETGWNCFSRQTIERILRALPYRLDWSWHWFNMPFAIPRRPDDPMRTWTIATEENPFQTVNGAGQLVNSGILHVRLRETKAPA